MGTVIVNVSTAYARWTCNCGQVVIVYVEPTGAISVAVLRHVKSCRLSVINPDNLVGRWEYDPILVDMV